MRKSAKYILTVGAIIFMCGGVRAEDAALTPMTWGDCVKMSAKFQPDLISSQQSIKSSQADKTITASGLFPQIGTNLNVSRSNSSGGSSSGGSGGSSGGSSGPVNNFNYGVTGNQLLFDGFQTINKVNSAVENIKASQQSYNFTSSQVRQRLRTAFVKGSAGSR